MLLKKLIICASIVFSFCSILSLSSCGDDDSDENGSGSEVNTNVVNTGETAVTGGVANIFVNGAVVYGYVNVTPEMLPVVKFGLLYSTKKGVNIDNYEFKADSKSLDGQKFSVVLDKLIPSTCYYYRTYVCIGDNYTYGTERQLTTKSVNTRVEFKKIDGPNACFTCTFTTDDYLHGSASAYGVICSTNSNIKEYDCLTYRGFSLIIKENGEITNGHDLIRDENGGFMKDVQVKNYYLQPSFYYCAYTYVDGKFYFDKDNIQKITVPELKNIGLNNGYTYVDLGLSVKWATYNVDAKNPDDYGEYFAWGDCWQTYDGSWKEYCWADDNGKPTKYDFSDNKKTLDLEDDAAHNKWGGTWRIPTYKEMEELLNNCDYVESSSLADGIVLTSKINGEQIYFPYAGCLKNHIYYNKGKIGYYWASSGSYYTANCLVIERYAKLSSLDRAYGLSIRAVCP